MQFQSDYFRLVTLVIPGVTGGNTNTSFTFQDQPDLRYARMISIQTYFAEDMSHAQPQATPVIQGSLANKVSFNFQTNDPDDLTKRGGRDGRFTGTLNTIQWVPATALHTIQTTGVSPAGFVRYPTYWKDRYVIWQKSECIIAPLGLGNTTDVAIVLGVHYTFLNTDGKEIQPRN